MMGSKDRAFAPLVNVSLEQLVPADHFAPAVADAQLGRGRVYYPFMPIVSLATLAVLVLGFGMGKGTTLAR